MAECCWNLLVFLFPRKHCLAVLVTKFTTFLVSTLPWLHSCHAKCYALVSDLIIVYQTAGYVHDFSCVTIRKLMNLSLYRYGKQPLSSSEKKHTTSYMPIKPASPANRIIMDTSCSKCHYILSAKGMKSCN